MVTTPSMIGVLRRRCYSAVRQFCCMPPTASIIVSNMNCQIASQHVGHSQLPCLQTFCHHLHSSRVPAASQVVANSQNPPKAPWTPTAQLTKRKLLTKRMGFLLQVSQFAFSEVVFPSPCFLLETDSGLISRPWKQSKLQTWTNPENFRSLVLGTS